MMLSLSPKADGTIPEGQQQPLREVGAWLQHNGEAIYGTRAWDVHGEGDEEKLMNRSGKHVRWEYDKCTVDDRRYTRSKDGQTIYAMTLGIPEKSVIFEALNKVAVRSVELLGSDQSVSWTQSDAGLVIEPNGTTFNSELAVAWKVSLK